MKNVWFAILLFISAACNSQQDSGHNINVNEFEKGITLPDVQVLDVRTAGEFQSGHIKNALLANWNDKTEFNERIRYVDKDKPVYVYCLGGSRSAAAADWMRQNGFKHVYDLIGGINAWKRENKPVEGLSNEPQMSMTDYQARINSSKTVLVDFGADWCPPCVKMKPVLNELEKNQKLNFLLVKIDAGVQTNIMKELNIEPIPVFVVYKNGKEVWRKQGIISKEELEKQLK
ncbi:MAG: thioredoxin fold domain-containing protein [Bacteroidetes bacterium]|nr:thioredoxin fold domain-containing protein [Bacteroidota bacterium]